jgi:hypothetical protein
MLTESSIYPLPSSYCLSATTSYASRLEVYLAPFTCTRISYHDHVPSSHCSTSLQIRLPISTHGTRYVQDAASLHALFPGNC